MTHRLTGSLRSCDLCLRGCAVDRSAGKKGFCGAGDTAVVYNYGPHHGEEPPLSGTGGSGTIFFSGCTMRCVYCQNFRFSQVYSGKEVSEDELSMMMLSLQEQGCHNINLVNPTHFLPQVVEALSVAFGAGLNIPVVYNSGGYDRREKIEMLDGTVDVYLPDMRYSDDALAREYSEAEGYVANNLDVVREMYDQTGPVVLDNGIATRGLIIRLLVMPEDVSGTVRTLERIAGSIGNKVYLSVMSQFYPAYRSSGKEKINRRITRAEYEEVISAVEDMGFENGWIQPFEGGFEERFAGENFVSNL